MRSQRMNWEPPIAVRFKEQFGLINNHFLFFFCSIGKRVASCSSGELVWHHLDGGCALGRHSHCFWQQRNRAEWQVRPLFLWSALLILCQEVETQARRKWVNGVLLLPFLGLPVLTLTLNLVGIFVDPVKAPLFAARVWNPLRDRCKSGMWKSKW